MLTVCYSFISDISVVTKFCGSVFRSIFAGLIYISTVKWLSLIRRCIQNFSKEMYSEILKKKCIWNVCYNIPKLCIYLLANSAETNIHQDVPFIRLNSHDCKCKRSNVELFCRIVLVPRKRLHCLIGPVELFC